MTPQDRARATTAEILTDYTSGAHRGLVVDSPPGAGKTTLVVSATIELVKADQRLMIVAQTNEQVDDLVDKLASNAPGTSIGRLHAEGFEPPDRVTRHPGVTLHNKIENVENCQVVVATADKWAYISGRAWEWAIVDEAYQMRSDKLLAVAPLFAAGHTLFVGDPGQLDPFSVIESDRWTGMAWDPLQSAVAVTQRINNLKVHQLPVSWRLPASAAPIVSRAFYPAAGFSPGTAPGDRRLELTVPGPRDPTIEEAAASGWALHELPDRHTVRTDPEVAHACATLARRILERGTVAHDEHGSHPVTPDRIAIGCAHNDQVAAVRAAGAPEGVTIDTANRLQGREYDITLVWHPLSGRRDATAFHLESGRLCVLTSRHRHACVVVARAGIPALLDHHPSSPRIQLNVPIKFPDGWTANHTILAHLEQHRIRSHML
ncbi:AAA family ATPase [Acrocarpospora macrocephala]|uniref:Helicase n=1 Tax=Acrocarpospora macrocephala TaxID=150177 RepID=A0A5M3WWW7_9ACTN|nr:AAA family ATPase [Acrocarpospora macrocephala]GES13935.1 helicase [Acrocarpospora macrocephala]